MTSAGKKPPDAASAPAGGARPLPVWHPAFLAATWFGAGLMPRVPGTWGSLAALPFAWAIDWAGGTWGLATATVAVFLIGWWASKVVVERLGVDDPGVVVIDEVAGQWLILLVVPRDPALYLLSFFLFRFLDIWKPFPANWADRYVKDGLGVMLDDIFAAAYGVAVMGVVAWLVRI